MRNSYKTRISHGVIPTLENLTLVTEKVAEANNQNDLPFSFAVAGDTSRFGYLFPDLQVLESLLPETPETREALIALGMSMREPDGDATVDSLIPSVYTYLGQFVDHDITLEAKSEGLVFLSDPNLRPLTTEDIRNKITNGRQPGLDLDNIYYKPAPRSHSNLLVGVVSPVRPPDVERPPGLERVPGKDLRNDLPRRSRNADPQFDRAALGGDARNDENLIVAQLHVAFLRAHNAIAGQGHTFDEARTILRQPENVAIDVAIKGVKTAVSILAKGIGSAGVASPGEASRSSADKVAFEASLKFFSAPVDSSKSIVYCVLRPAAEAGIEAVTPS